MSFVEGPKSRFTSIAPAIVAGANAHGSHALQPGCVQCGSLLEIVDRKKANFSGKCFSCQNWVSDEEEEFEDFED